MKILTPMMVIGSFWFLRFRFVIRLNFAFPHRKIYGTASKCQGIITYLYYVPSPQGGPEYLVTPVVAQGSFSSSWTIEHLAISALYSNSGFPFTKTCWTAPMKLLVTPDILCGRMYDLKRLLWHRQIRFFFDPSFPFIARSSNEL